jgi:hypothetical protein
MAAAGLTARLADARNENQRNQSNLGVFLLRAELAPIWRALYHSSVLRPIGRTNLCNYPEPSA